MNELIQKSVNELTMSSREIAELCGKEHRNVCRDIENLNLEYGKLSLLKIEQCDYTADNGQTYREFRLTKEQTIDLITGYRADLRIRINRRWQELEQATTPTDPQPVQPIGEIEDKLRAIVFALEHTTLSDVAKETAIVTSVETLTGISIGHRPQIEQTTYSAKELGDVLGISANRVGRIANAHGLKTKEYGLYYLNKSPHSDKQVEHFRYFEKSIDKFKSILENA